MSDTTEYQQLIEAVRHMREWQKQHPGAPLAFEQLAAAEQSVDIALAQHPAPSAEAPAEIWDYEAMTVGGEWINESRANGPPDTGLFVIRNLTKRAATPPPAAVHQPLTWQPVETAPSDTVVLLYSPERHFTNPERIESAIYRDSRAGWNHAWATHWMPLPPFPAIEAGITGAQE